MIKINFKNDKKKFIILNKCDTFIYNENVYMKTQIITNKLGDEGNAIRLDTGCLEWFSDDDLIKPIDLDATVKEWEYDKL